MEEKIPRAECRSFGRVHKKPRLMVDNLDPDAACIAAYNGLALPHSFGDRKAESLLEGFLEHDI